MMASDPLSKLWIPFTNDLLDGDLCKKNWFPYFLFFMIFNHNFIIYIDFTHIASQIRLHT